MLSVLSLCPPFATMEGAIKTGKICLSVSPGKQEKVMLCEIQEVWATNEEGD